MKKFFQLVFALTLSCCGCSLAQEIPQTILSQEPREIRVYLRAQRFGLYEKGKLKLEGPVCTGKAGHETPKGSYRILEKAPRRLSSEATKKQGKKVFMPHALQFTAGLKSGKGGHFIHTGEVLSKPSSNGCVRLKGEDAKKVFEMLAIKDLVLILD